MKRRGAPAGAGAEAGGDGATWLQPAEHDKLDRRRRKPCD